MTWLYMVLSVSVAVNLILVAFLIDAGIKSRKGSGDLDARELALRRRERWVRKLNNALQARELREGV